MLYHTTDSVHGAASASVDMYSAVINGSPVSVAMVVLILVSICKHIKYHGSCSLVDRLQPDSPHQGVTSYVCNTIQKYDKSFIVVSG